jgi:hypothetical protein
MYQYNFYKRAVNCNWNVFYLLQSHSPQHVSVPTGDLQDPFFCDFVVVYACGPNYSILIYSFSSQSKAIPVTGRGGL